MLVYQAAFAAQYKDEETGLYRPKKFEEAAEVFDELVSLICAEVWATEEPTLFLTGNRTLLPIYNRWRKTHGQAPIQYRPNFREDIATTRSYKERKSDKPFHYANLQAYALSRYDTVVAWGMEADDLLAVEQEKRYSSLDTIICSRDKDLRQVPGMQYSWECAGQPGWGPTKVDPIGVLTLTVRYKEKDGKQIPIYKLKGTGLKFFYAQTIMGDPVDTIPGLRGGGIKMAFDVVDPCTTEREMYEAVGAKYEKKFGEGWEEQFLEQARLLWMVRELDEDGSPVMYQPPKVEND